MKTALASLLVAAAATPGLADPAAPPLPDPQPAPTYIALAMADGPTADERLVLSIRASSADAAISQAVKTCYERAAPGYMHTCRIGYGNAWVVATSCPQSASTVAFAIGDDVNSPEAASEKAVRYLRDVEHADVSTCHVAAEYNADDMQVARSVAKGAR